MVNRQAYLIMAHNQFDLLKILIQTIDYELNDIYIHIDKRVKLFNEKEFKNIVTKSNLFFVEERISINWATYDQIECELLLLKTARKHYNYTYYHLLSGQDLLLKGGKCTYEFFERNYGKEFIQFESNPINSKYLNRVNKYHFIIKKNPNIFVKIIQQYLLLSQFFINRIRKYNLIFQKGANWFHITDKLADYVISQEKIIGKIFSYSISGDEMFLQTLVANSSFIKNVVDNNFNDNYANIMYCILWNKNNTYGLYEFCSEDYDYLIKSGMLFARKFNWDKDKNIVLKILDYCKRLND